MEDLREELGAGPPAGTLQVTLFVPSVDRDGHPIDQGRWREEALRVFGRLFRGGTAFHESSLRELRRFLHRLGREARQGEVGIVVGGNYYGITEFDDAKA